MNYSWIPLNQASHSCLEKNLIALERNQPGLAAKIKAHGNGSHIQVSIDAFGLYACRYKTKKGEWMVHGEQPVGDEINKYFQPVQQAYQKGAWITVLLGVGTGILLPSIAAYLEQHHRGEPKGVLVVEKDPSLLYAGLCLYDFSAVLLSGRILFALGPNLSDSVQETLQRHRLETLDSSQITFVAGYRVEDPDQKPDYQRAHDDFFFLHEKKRADYFALLRKAERYWSNGNKSIKRVWTHVTEERSAGSIITGLSEGFSELGLASRTLLLPDLLFTRFYRCAYDVFSFLPDLILCINHSSKYVASFIEQVPIPRLVWYVDHPTKTVEVPFHPHDYVIAVAEDFKDEIVRRGGNYLGVVPVASTNEVYDPPVRSAWKHDVAYVGSVVDQSHIIRKLPADVQKWVQTVVNGQIEQPLLPMSAVMAQRPLPQKRLVQLAEALKPSLAKARYMNPQQTVEYFLYTEANTQRRVQVITALDAFSSLGIYGPPDWKRLLPQHQLPCYLGSIDSNKDLTDLYRSSKINLSINSLQGFGFVNIRTFQVPAAGGFLLTEYCPGMETFFAREKELAWYQTLEELIQTAKERLGDDISRTTTIRRAQKRIREEHTYQSRARLILDLFKSAGVIKE